jgi:hypothetical protein
VYLSDSDLEQTTGNVPIWDISNPAAPVLVTEFKHLVSSPHDITFNADGSRAYAAAVTVTYILNTEDPKNPTVISTIPNEGISISHQADPTPDGRYLLVSDEVGGGAAGASPGGPVHIYDISNEAQPVKTGFVWDDCVGVSNTCEGDTAVPPTSTAHVFRINPDGYTMAIAWYNDGVHVIDYASVRSAQAAGSGALTSIGPRTIGRMRMPNANTWSAKMWMERHPGYVFANDINRGLDVFFVPSMAQPGWAATGSIAAGHPATKLGGGASETAHTVTCDRGMPGHGVDARAIPISEEVAQGGHNISVKGKSAGAYDLDVYWYNSECGWMDSGDLGGTEADPAGPVTEGAAWAVVSAAAGTQISFNVYITPK